MKKIKPKKPSYALLSLQVDEFNKKHKIGDEVFLSKDSGETVKTKVKYPAEILSGHSAVAWFEGISGCYKIDRIQEAQ